VRLAGGCAASAGTHPPALAASATPAPAVASQERGTVGAVADEVVDSVDMATPCARRRHSETCKVIGGL
jgi:hypothetical protein